MKNIHRRDFLEQALATAAALAVPSAGALVLAAPRPVGLNDRVQIGVIGVRGRGRGHIGAFKKSPNAEVVAICDPDSGVIGGAMESVPDARYERDLRALLDDPSIDAVSIATPNHWHALATIWALEAGKHVYVEKPISYNVAEGRAVVAAARRSGRIVQHGTQARSHVATRDALAWLRGGGLGRVTRAHGLCYKQRDSIGKVTTAPALPPTLDYDLWTGPAAMEPLGRENLHYDWHWDFNTGNGDIGNQGAHQMDIARWGLGIDDFPRHVMSVGGRLGYDDDGETPNSQIVHYDFGDKEIVFEVRGLATGPNHTAHIGVIFFGEAGYLVSSSYAKLVAYDHGGNVIRTFTGGGNHFQNFLDAVASGNAADLNASALEGHRSIALCHLGNISHHLGRPETLSSTVAPFGAHSAANTAFDEFRAHLVANGLDPSRTACAVGPMLAFDDASETFHGSRAEEANALLARADRAPYVVREDSAG